MKFFLISVCLLFISSLLSAQVTKEIDSLESVLESASPDDKTAILNRLSILYQNISIDKSIEYDLQNLEINRELGKIKNQSTILNNLAISYYQTGQYYKSIETFEQSLAILEELGDTNVIMKTLNNLGVLTQTVGQYDKSLIYLKRALEYKLKQNDTASIAKTLNNIGVMHMNIGKLQESKKYLKEAFQYYEILDDDESIADVYNNLGQLYHAEGDSDSALILYEKSLIIKKQTDNYKGTANTLNNIGLIYSEKEQYDKAIEYFDEAIKIREEIGDIYGLSSAINNLANLYRAKNEFPKALELYNRSNQIATKENLRGIIERNYSGMSRIFEDKKEFSNALKYYKLSHNLKDSIFTEDFNKKLANLEIEYELEKREQETKILKQKNQIQDLQLTLYSRQKTLLIIAISLIFIISITGIFAIRNINRKKINDHLTGLNKELQSRVRERTEELEKTNKKKDQLLSIIAHDLRSPFNSILGFSEILSKDTNKLTDKEKEELTKQLHSSASNYYKLLENLLEWARIQSGNFKINKENILLNALINESIQTITNEAVRKEIKINFNTKNNFYANADLNMVSAIIRNVLSNAIKFSHRGGSINILMDEISTNNNNFVKISISDNGIGISDKDMENIFRIDKNMMKEGTEGESGTGMGLVLCHEFIILNNGKIWAESKINEGTTIHFTLPKT